MEEKLKGLAKTLAKERWEEEHKDWIPENKTAEAFKATVKKLKIKSDVELLLKFYNMAKE